MVSSGLLRRVALVRTDVSEEPGASFIRVTKIGELGTTQVFLRSVRRWLVAACVVPSSPIFVFVFCSEQFFRKIPLGVIPLMSETQYHDHNIRNESDVKIEEKIS
jgi:hypothetical protein